MGMNNNLNKTALNQELILTIHNLLSKEYNKNDSNQIEIASNHIIQDVTDYKR
jgi:hypothetical protein